MLMINEKIGNWAEKEKWLKKHLNGKFRTERYKVRIEWT